MSQIESLRLKFENEEKQLNERLAIVRAILAELPGSGVKQPSSPSPTPKGPTNGRQRAPRGSLPDAIKAVLKAKPGMTNAEIRTAIAATGYAWPMGGIHVSKNLLKLVADKEIISKQTGKIFRYTLK